VELWNVVSLACFETASAENYYKTASGFELKGSAGATSGISQHFNPHHTTRHTYEL